MVGIELVQQKSKKIPFPASERIGQKIAMTARTLGMLIRPIGTIMILMPPLSASVKELEQMVSILKLAISVVRSSSPSSSIQTPPEVSLHTSTRPR